MRITAGQNAGSILRIKNPQVFERHDLNAVQRNYSWFTGGPRSTQPKIVDSGDGIARDYGELSIDGQLFIPSDATIHLEDDQTGKVIKLWRYHSSNRTMKPHLLLDYEGPTILTRGRPVRTSPTLIDRFGQEVGVGDVVLLGQNYTGTLLAGKISKISDSFGVWIKHIGSKDDHYEKACQGNQLLKLKDLEKVLMLEKLKSL
jgi:hypothetical protein